MKSVEYQKQQENFEKKQNEKQNKQKHQNSKEKVLTKCRRKRRSLVQKSTPRIRDSKLVTTNWVRGEKISNEKSRKIEESEREN